MADKNSAKKRNRVLTIILIIFAGLYVPSFIHWIYGDKVETAVLTQGSIEDTIESEALFVRDEEVVNSPFTGRCVINVAQGEKAASGQAVATLLKDSSVQALEELRNKDIEILNAKNEKAKAQEIFSEDISRVDVDISAKLKQLILADNAGNSEYSFLLKQDIDKLIEKKADILGGTGATDEKIQHLVSERNNLQNLVNSYTKQVYTPVSGIITYAVDGLEGALKVNQIKELTMEQFDTLKPTTNEVKGNAISVTQDKPIFKIIKSIEQYIVLKVPENKLSDFEVGKTSMKIRINQLGNIYDGVVYNVSAPVDGKALVTFRMEKGLHETSALRRVNAEIIEKSSTGLKVPVKSLVDFDETNNTAKIMLLKANFATLREVEVLEHNEEVAIIAPSKDPAKGIISLYDNYLVNPQNIQEGQLIEK